MVITLRKCSTLSDSDSLFVSSGDQYGLAKTRFVRRINLVSENSSIDIFRCRLDTQIQSCRLNLSESRPYQRDYRSGVSLQRTAASRTSITTVLLLSLNTLVQRSLSLATTSLHRGDRY